MSHFNVLVIGDDANAALEPFQQYHSDEPDEYLSFVDLETALRQEYETQGEDVEIHLPGGEVLSGKDIQFFSLETCKFSYPADAKVVIKRPYREMYATFEEFVLQMEGIANRNEIAGRYGHYENLNGKFDWMHLGGRWQGFFALKAGATGKLGEAPVRGTPVANDGSRADVCAVSSIDFEATARKAVQLAGEQWDSLMAENLPESVLRSLNVHGVSREEFCSRAEKTCFGVAAVVRDGVWYERGSALPWGSKLENLTVDEWALEVATLIKSLPGDTKVSLFDCHA